MRREHGWLARSSQLDRFKLGVVPGTVLLPFVVIAWANALPSTGGLKVGLTMVWFAAAIGGVVASAVVVRCPVCGWRPVALGAASRLLVAQLDACPHCGDDGSGRDMIARDSPRWGGRESERVVRRLVWQLLGTPVAVITALVAYGRFVSARNVDADLALMESHRTCDGAVNAVSWELSDPERSWFRTACAAVQSDGLPRAITLHGFGNSLFPVTAEITVVKEGNLIRLSAKAHR